MDFPRKLRSDLLAGRRQTELGSKGRDSVGYLQDSGHTNYLSLTQPVSRVKQCAALLQSNPKITKLHFQLSLTTREAKYQCKSNIANKIEVINFLSAKYFLPSLAWVVQQYWGQVETSPPSLGAKRLHMCTTCSPVRTPPGPILSEQIFTGECTWALWAGSGFRPKHALAGRRSQVYLTCPCHPTYARFLRTAQPSIALNACSTIAIRRRPSCKLSNMATSAPSMQQLVL